MKQNESQKIEFAILDYLPVGMCIIDSNFTVQFWNKTLENWTGLKTSQILGTNLLNHYPHLKQPKYLRRIESLFFGGTPITFSSYLHKYIFPPIDTNIEAKIQHTTVTAISSDKENEYWAMFSIEDVTELTTRVENLKRVENELTIANAAKDRFFSIIAHDMRNPFNVIFSYTRLINQNFERFSKEEILKLNSELNKSTDKAYKLLENLLEWSKSQTGGLKFEPTNFKLMDLIDDVVNLLNESTNQKSIKLITNINTDIFVKADKNMIATVLRNLITNAIKFTHENGIIDINAEIQGKMVLIKIRDSGVGMGQEKIDNLFRVDVKTSTQGTNEEKGSGLGLILCKDFVEKNGGYLKVKSEIGKGSTFTFSVPGFFSSSLK